MAINILTQPQEFTPAYNEMVYIVDSSYKLQCNFQYIFDIYIDGNFITRLDRVPFGPDNYGIVDIKEICSNYVSYDLQENLVGFKPNPNSIKSVYIYFGEEWDTSIDCSEGVTKFPAVAGSTVTYFWNGALSKKEFYNYNSGEWVRGGSVASWQKWLSRVPSNTRIGIDDKFALNYLQYNDLNPDGVLIQTFDISNNVIDTYTIDNSYNGTFFQNWYMISFGCGPTQLNASTLSLGSQPVIDNDVYFYEVTLQYNGGGCSDTKRFEIDRRCSKFPVKRLMFFNTLGGFDSYSFNMQSETNINIVRNEYTKRYGQVTGSSYGYKLRDRGTTLTSVDAYETYIFNSDWMSEAEALWIRDCYTTLEAYLYEPVEKNVYEINGAICENLNDYKEIQGGLYNGGFVDFLIDDGGFTIPNGTSFSYVLDSGAILCISNSGTGSITANIGGGVYTTSVVAGCDPGIGAILAGTFSTPYPAIPTTSSFIFTTSVNTEVGDYIYYELESGTCLGASASGYGTVTKIENGVVSIDVPCTGQIGCTTPGTFSTVNRSSDLDPLILTSNFYAEKYTTTTKNIDYVLEAKSATKINIQRN